MSNYEPNVKVKYLEQVLFPPHRGEYQAHLDTLPVMSMPLVGRHRCKNSLNRHARLGKAVSIPLDLVNALPNGY